MNHIYIIGQKLNPIDDQQGFACGYCDGHGEISGAFFDQPLAERCASLEGGTVLTVPLYETEEQYIEAHQAASDLDGLKGWLTLAMQKAESPTIRAAYGLVLSEVNRRVGSKVNKTKSK